jgi:hypothetical protein
VASKSEEPGAPKTVARRIKWSAHKRAAFLEHLAISSNVAASERVADVPAGSAYKFRNRDSDFRAAWEAALKTGYDRLELAVLERAINGQVVKRTTKGDETTEEFKYDDRVATTLLNAHRATVAAIAARQEGDSAKRTLARKLDAVARRLGNDA